MGSSPPKKSKKMDLLPSTISKEIRDSIKEKNYHKIPFLTSNPNRSKKNFKFHYLSKRK